MFTYYVYKFSNYKFAQALISDPTWTRWTQHGSDPIDAPGSPGPSVLGGTLMACTCGDAWYLANGYG